MMVVYSTAGVQKMMGRQQMVLGRWHRFVPLCETLSLNEIIRIYWKLLSRKVVMGMGTYLWLPQAMVVAMTMIVTMMDMLIRHILSQ